MRLPKSITGTFEQRVVDALPDFLRKALTGLLDQIDALSREITGYDQQIGVLAGQHPELARLESIPGVGRLTAMTFVLTLGRAERFAHSRDVTGFLIENAFEASPILEGVAQMTHVCIRKLLIIRPETSVTERSGHMGYTVTQNPKTEAREAQFEFYHGAMMEFKRFKNKFRNRIMPAREHI